VIIPALIGLLVGAIGVWLWARGEIARRDDRLAIAERTDEQWQEHLKALTSDVLGEASETLLSQSGQQLQPIADTLRKFEEQSRELERKRLTEVSPIPVLLQGITEGQDRLRKETGNLVTALRAPDVRGRWGEMQLRRVVELAGMVDHCDFVTQATERDFDGNLLKPDLIVNLAGGKNIVVDAKTPLDAYLDAIAAEDEVSRKEHLTRHARLVREHMTKLGQKQYWKQFDPAPEFTVMFISDEAFWRAALDHDPSLLQAGVEARVIPASPTTLIALLFTVAYAWQQETIAENSRDVEKLGRELYDRLRIVAKHFAKVGKNLGLAGEAYNEAVGSLDRNLLSTARKLQAHGISGDELPETVVLAVQPRPFVAPELQELDGVTELPRAADAA
jgi:DNA recombination protein RmuC